MERKYNPIAAIFFALLISSQVVAASACCHDESGIPVQQNIQSPNHDITPFENHTSCELYTHAVFPSKVINIETRTIEPDQLIWSELLKFEAIYEFHTYSSNSISFPSPARPIYLLTQRFRE
ncbi:MAG: hypothetical protein OEX03_11270 [Gammaproteobacteria bacterium]|nr:hypothetical protein [Gammaproteobacteria bacterium]